MIRNLFKRTRRAHPQEVLDHLTDAATAAYVDGSPEARQALAEHLAGDLSNLDRDTIVKALGVIIATEGHRRAVAIRASLREGLDALFTHLQEEADRAEAQGAQERPTDLQADDEPTLDPEDAETGAQPGDVDGNGDPWAEDRR